MYKWYLPTLSEVVARSEWVQAQPESAAQQQVRAEREWSGAIAALNLLLQQTSAADAQTLSGNSQSLIRGVVLSGPLPVLEQPELVNSVSAWTFTVNALGNAAWMPFQLLPANHQKILHPPSAPSTVPLMPNDPLATEQFCLVLTPDFSLVMVLGEDTAANPAFLFSFEPEVVGRAWQALRARLIFTNPNALTHLDELVEKFAPVVPDYRMVMEFSRLMLAHLPEPIELESTREPVPPSRSAEQVGKAPRSEWFVVDEGSGEPTFANGHAPASPSAQEPLEKLSQSKESFDTELLQAIAHEVRTPLTTIRTLTRLLLKRKDLSPDVIKRLGIIDQECTEQIDRFNLIFRAVELETSAVKHPLTPLAPISLTQVFEQNLPRWQQMAEQRSLTLEILLPQKLPMVVTDPTMLDQVLTGLIDRITLTLPPGSHIQVRVTLAGHQLKLQFESQLQAEAGAPDRSGAIADGCTPSLKSLGQLLMFQPETGSLSLNLAVTKNLFQALGGKMIVRQRPQQGEVLTVFLPLESRRQEE